jgi:hypothetical protein
MDNWLANIVGDVDSLHVKIDNLNDPLMGFCFIRSIDELIFLISVGIGILHVGCEETVVCSISGSPNRCNAHYVPIRVRPTVILDIAHLKVRG